MGCDFNPTFFSHPNCDPLTLSSPNEETRRFWIEHGKACIRISSYLADELQEPCVMNIWTGDGFKDIPADRIGPRVPNVSAERKSNVSVLNSASRKPLSARRR